MKNPKLYQEFTAAELDVFLQGCGTALSAQTLTELKEAETDFYGNFIVFAGYKFKLTYGVYSCMETPTEKHIKNKTGVMFTKAKNDILKK